MNQKATPRIKRITTLVALLSASLEIIATPLEDEMGRVVNGIFPEIVDQGQRGVPLSISARMEFYHIPGLSIAVIDDGKIVWTRGFGFQDMGENTLVTPKTLFQAGSVSKPITALGALSLVQRGILDLDENVNSYLKSWSVSDNEFTTVEKVTLRRLLIHSAGLTVHGFPGYTAGDRIPELHQILDGSPPANTPKIEVNVVPGKQYRYSGGGYTVMQQMINDVTNKPFHDTMQKLVLKPIQMNDSSYEQPLPINKRKEAASGYYANLDKVEGKYHTYPEKAAAGLWTTPTDLAKYIIEVQNTVGGNSGKIINQTLTNQMLERQISNQGLGPRLQGSGKTKRFSHGGRNDGFDTMMVGYVNIGKGAVLMSNSNNNQSLFTEVLDSIAREYKWPDYELLKQREKVSISPEDLKKYVAVYTSLDMPFDIELKLIDGQLHGQATGQANVHLTAISTSEFFFSGANITLIFAKNRDKTINLAEFTLNQWGRNSKFVRKEK